MKFSEVKGDLFGEEPTSALAHCISEDVAMGKGIAVLFKNKFGGVAELKGQVAAEIDLDQVLDTRIKGDVAEYKVFQMMPRVAACEQAISRAGLL